MSEGIFSWFDFNANDVDKAKAFYGEVVGWTTRAWGDEGYQMWMVNKDTAIGGVMKMPEQPAAAGAPPHWLAFISTENADATAKRTVELGGNVLAEPFDIDDVGRAAILKDPQGAVFAAIQFEGDAMEPPSPSTPGAFCWTELMTTDWKAAYEFYNSLFGWEKTEAMNMGDKGTYQMFKTPGEIGGGMMNMTPQMPMPSWLYYITTDDLDAATKRAQQNGAQTVAPPMDVPGGRIAIFMDNQGGAFGLHQSTTE